MKKDYIIPCAKFINIASEGSLLTNSLTGEEGQPTGGSGSAEESGRRHRNIWGEEY